MARKSVNATLGQSLGEGRYSSVGGLGAPVAIDVSAIEALSDVAVAAKVSVSAVDAAIAVLVADAAAPTQAHVNTANTAWGTLSTAITALHAAVDAVEAALETLDTGAAATANVVVDIGAAVITKKAQLQSALAAAFNQFVNTGAVVD